MEELFKDFLFTKNYLVADNHSSSEEESALLCTALMAKYGYNTVKGGNLVTRDVFTYVAGKVDEKPVEPFYRGFPESVEKLCPEEFLFDQLFSYYKSYGLEDFSEEQHSVLEEPVKRVALLKSFTVKNVMVLTETEARETLVQIVKDLCKGSRPLNVDQYGVVCAFVKEYNILPEIKSSNTVIKLLLDTKNIYLSDNLNISEFPKIVEELNYANYNNTNIKKLNLKNQDRKFLKAVLSRMLSLAENADMYQCLEKRDIWKGILHHLHFTDDKLQSSIYADYIQSHSGHFQELLNNDQITSAIRHLKRVKGSSAVMRSADYILSRCEGLPTTTKLEVMDILEEIAANSNNIVLLQMLNHYATFDRGARSYSFTKFNLKKNHTQTREEWEASKTKELSSQDIAEMKDILLDALYDHLRKVDVGKVYIDPAFKKIALPLNMAASNSGVGSLPSGSRIAIPEGAIVRAFTYWEKVNDIDLSAMLYDEDMNVVGEFSWRSYASMGAASSGFVFSGDQTCGYKGGSEYFDFDLETIQKKNPEARYIVLNDNVYSRVNFSDCYCKAGFMLRDSFKSGEAFEPKTVQTSYLVTAKSTYCHLFAIDMKTREIVWLNVNKNSSAAVGGIESGSYLKKYMKLAESLNIYDTFSHLGIRADSLEDCADKRDLILIPDRQELTTKADIITLQDMEKINKYLEA